MKIQEISECEIAKIHNNNPFIASNFLKNKISYEWFYIEIIHNKSHIVLILSTKDCFYNQKKGIAPASIYLTWHDNNKLVAYSYSILTEDIADEFQNKMKEYINGNNKELDLWIPDFSLDKVIHFNLQSSSSNFDSEINPEINSEKEHFWQFIQDSQSANGFIETVYFPVEKYKNNFYLLSFFHDIPTKNKLKNTSCHRIHFKNSRLYFDHNFGFQPLNTIKNEWCWWHIEQKNNWEVCYFFPKINKSFFISSQIEETKILDHKDDDVIFKKRFNIFLFFAPKKIATKFFGTLNFNKIIECAPFYIRSKLSTNKEELTATLEYLIPKRTLNSINQGLMSARQVQILKMIKNKKDLETFLPFEEICKNITKNNGTSFYLASIVIAKKDRNKSYLIYALCRLIDDATDEKETNIIQNYSAEGASFSTQLLDVLWGETPLQLNSEFLFQLKSRLEHSLSRYIDETSALNFIECAKKEIVSIQLQKSYFEELVLGQFMDENFIQPKNFDEFYLYCYRVAGVVGLMMSQIFSVPNNKQALKAAEHLGIAMQITNILRDVKEDYEMGRVYLPLDSCVKNNIDMNEKIFNDAFLKQKEKIQLIQEFSSKAIYYYKSAIGGINFIPKFRYRFCVRLMCAIYSGIASKILKDNLIVFEQRVIVSRVKKFFIFIKVLFGVNPLTSSGIKLNKQNQETN